MNRIFHRHIAWTDYLYLLLLGGTAFYFLWVKQIIPATIVMILLIILVERIIHTTYTITADKQLILSYGRFSKFRPIPVETIRKIEKVETFKIGTFRLTHYLLITTPSGNMSVTPIKEKEMMEYLLKVNPYIQIE